MDQPSIESDVSMYRCAVWLAFTLGLLVPIVLAVLLWLSPAAKAEPTSYASNADLLAIWIAFGFLGCLGTGGALQQRKTRLAAKQHRKIPQTPPEVDAAIHLFAVWLALTLGLLAPIALAVLLWLSPAARAELASNAINAESLAIWIAFGFLGCLVMGGALHQSKNRLASRSRHRAEAGRSKMEPCDRT